MTRKGKWRALAVILTAGMLSSQALPVYAAPVTVSGQGTTEQDGVRYNGKDDIKMLATNPTDVNVEAKVSGGPEIIYSVDIEWGAMQFVYDYGSTWNPTTHTYGPALSGQQGGGWVSSYVNADNNKITVTNNSNFPVTADFEYTGGTVLNADPTVNGSVVGIFSYINNSLTAPGVLDAGLNGTGITPTMITPETMTLEMNVKELPSNTGYYYKVVDPAKNTTDKAADSTDDIFFALSGKPDNGGPTAFTTVGQISITIAPAQGATPATIS